MLLMAAVRNVQIVCAHLTGFFFLVNRLGKQSMYFAQIVFTSIIANSSLIIQARPTMYQVMKDMVHKMGYTVSGRLIIVASTSM